MFTSRSRPILPAFGFLAAFFISLSPAYAQERPLQLPQRVAREISPYREGEVLIRYKRSATGLSPGSPHRTLVASTIKRHRRIGVDRVRLAKGRDVKDAVQLLRNDPDVEHVEPNYQYRALLIPNDPYFDSMWALQKIEAPRAWEVTSGTTTVVVAVVDTGAFYTHPDLSPNLWVNPGEVPGDGIDNDHNRRVDDVRGWDFVQEDNDPLDLDGHGTHVAGIIAGAGNNGIGIAGVSWAAKIMPLKGLNDSGVGYTSDLIEAIEYASANGAHVINCSWGSPNYSRFLRDAICGSPALVVCAAGNDSNDNDAKPYYPAAYNCPNLVSVAATDQSDRLASFSNFGAASVHVGAPGVGILSTYISTPQGGPTQPAYAYAGGTSMAAPHVSGIASLIMAQNLSLSATQVRQALMNSVDLSPALNGKTVAGGRVNGYGALPPKGPSSLSVTNVFGNTMDLSWTDNAANETGFRVERKMGTQDAWSLIGSVAENTTTYRDPGADGSVVQYRVQAFNSASDSLYSNTATADSGPPTAVLSYSAPDPNHVDVGTLVITATFSEPLNGTPAIHIDRPNPMADIDAAMSGTGTVWAYTLTIQKDGGSAVDGLNTITLTAEDLQGHSMGAVHNNRFTTDTRDFDEDGTRDHEDTDDDNDGLPDAWEILYGMNHQNGNGTHGWDGDFDNDGWANWEEYLNGTNPADPAGPRPEPPVVQEVNPADEAGIRNVLRIPRNTAFGVRLKSAHGISLTDSSGLTLFITDGVTSYTRRLNDTNGSGVTLVQAVPLDSGVSSSEKLWLVYYRANESAVPPFFPHEAIVGVSVFATDIRKDSMAPGVFRFKIEGVTDSARDEENRPRTTTSVESGLTKIEVSEGDLRGAAILYDESVLRTGITPYFGTSDEIPALDISGVNGVGIPMKLRPPAVFPDGLTLRIPVPGYHDVSSLYVYYHNGEEWVVACNAAGQVQSGGEGWMIPGSRVNRNNGNPSTIEVRVYHFSAALAGSAPPPPPPSGGDDGSGGGGEDGGSDLGSTASSGSGGGGCFIGTLLQH
jgi:subtilisin family serine protease